MNITAGDFESYYQIFNYLATHIYNTSETIDSEKYSVSAREALFRSASYFRAATTYLYSNISDPDSIHSGTNKQLLSTKQSPSFPCLVTE